MNPFSAPSQPMHWAVQWSSRSRVRQPQQAIHHHHRHPVGDCISIAIYGTAKWNPGPNLHSTLRHQHHHHHPSRLPTRPVHWLNVRPSIGTPFQWTNRKDRRRVVWQDGVGWGIIILIVNWYNTRKRRWRKEHPGGRQDGEEEDEYETRKERLWYWREEGAEELGLWFSARLVSSMALSTVRLDVVIRSGK